MTWAWVEHALAAAGAFWLAGWAHWFLAGWLDRREVSRLMDDYRRRQAELERRHAR